MILTTRGPENAVGVHQYNVQGKKMSDFLYLVNVGIIVYAAANVLIKSSILLQYTSIFSPAAKDYFYWSCHFIIVLTIVTYTSIAFI
ncbi:hypothetical protein HYALB_00005680 [Hymenoscyphus albidus]|uniref:Rhodopsin domain-containing protein n=1 Tax=Hymenoscyphus albidus TaxID=595503 RepID=A0A9N9LH54_9HELO|nr:hypothetical protein HYALB_00005680 [Hymenoscyphus albidus]